MPDAQPNSPEVKAVIAFGSSIARRGPVPKALKISYQILMILSTIWAVIVQPIFASDIHVDTANKINQVLIALNTLYYQICQQFGWVETKNEDEGKTTEV